MKKIIIVSSLALLVGAAMPQNVYSAAALSRRSSSDMEVDSHIKIYFQSEKGTVFPLELDPYMSAGEFVRKHMLGRGYNLVTDKIRLRDIEGKTLQDLYNLGLGTKENPYIKSKS